MKLLLVACVLLTACAQRDYTIPLPAEVVVSGEVDSQEFALWEQEARSWNDAAPGVITEVNRKSHLGKCGRVFVTRRSDADCEISDAHTTLDGYGCDARIQICVLDEARYREAILHELGHIFGASDDAEWDTSRGIPAELAAEVRVRMGGVE